MTTSVHTAGAWHLLCLSGPDAASVEARAARAADLLATGGTPLDALADERPQPAGRVRRAVLARDEAHGAALLRGGDPWLVVNGVADPPALVVLMFPGVGDQHVGMARELYERLPLFRAELDRVSELLAPHLNQDVRELLFPPAQAQAPVGPAPGPGFRRPQEGAGTGPLVDTRVAQPLVFAVEYCLAKLLTGWGIRPAALAGYSVGEYVAACLAGVLDVEEALALVARRSSLIEDVPPGAMLVAMLSANELAPYLGTDLWLAAVNGPHLSVVSGTAPALRGLAGRLHSAGVATLPAPARHAFHSPLMSPVERPLRRLLATVPLAPPAIPVLSNVTGDWLTVADATSPEYWARHLCRPVRFAENLARMWALPHALAVEVGAGQMLASLANQHPDRPRAPGDGIALPTLTTRPKEHGEVAVMLRVLAQAWVRGACPKIRATEAAHTPKGPAWSSH